MPYEEFDYPEGFDEYTKRLFGGPREMWDYPTGQRVGIVYLIKNIFIYTN